MGSHDNSVPFVAAQLRLVFVVAALALVAACGRPQGDFGRASTELSITHDWILPLAGIVHASAVRKEHVSLFNFTEKEKKLRHKAWALVLPPHHNQWLGKWEAELQRTRILKPLKFRLGKNGYHFHLRVQRSQSSDARWNRFIDDMQSDIDLIDPFFGAARDVIAQDRQRLLSYQQLVAEGETRKGDVRGVMGRVHENDDVISWVLASLDHRYATYYYTLQRLEIEEPAAEAQVAKHARRLLARYHAAIAATRGDLDSNRPEENTKQPVVIKG